MVAICRWCVVLHATCDYGKQEGLGSCAEVTAQEVWESVFHTSQALYGCSSRVCSVIQGN